MGDQNKKTTNVTVDQIIEHMTADIQNADGQYIQLGFTPPPTPNDSHAWTEYSQNQHPQNPFVPHFSPRTAEAMPCPIDPNPRYMPQNVAYGNYMTQNTIYVPDLQNNTYEKHVNLDIHGNKYLLYPGQQPQYVITNPDIPVCGYMPVYPENRDYALFTNQEMQNIQMQQNSVLPNNQSGSEHIFMSENVILQQNHQEALKNNLLMHQNMQPQQNRTHLIENLVCNWAQNTNGTYSPFGNAQPQNTQNFFENVSKTDINIQNNITLTENSSNVTDINDRSNDFNVKNFKTPINKKKQVAEVKPMRPTYSDVLAKSVPQQMPKTEKFEVKDSKTKSSIKKSAKADKFAKISLNRQNSTNGDKENFINNSQKLDKTPDPKINLARKWVSLDDVNEVHSNNDLFKVNDLHQEHSGSKSTTKKNKKFEILKNENTSVNKNGIKKSFLDNSSLGCQWTESEDVSESSKNDDRNVGKNPTKKGKTQYFYTMI